MKRVLVAGGAGFLGSHLVEELISLGYQVVSVDNQLTGQTKNLEAVQNNKNFTYIKHDITEPFGQDLGDIDEVYHLASVASPPEFARLGIEIMRANANGTERLLDLCKQKNAKFLLASTSEIYGDPLEHPQREDYWGNVNPTGARSVYDESKRYAEAYTTHFCKQHAMPFAIARIFNTYGPRMAVHDGRVMSNFICQSLRGEAITIYGDGTQTRSFCYVKDEIAGLMAAMEVSATVPINIGSDQEITINELAKTINSYCQSVGIEAQELQYKQLPQDDPKRRRPDISRAKELLGWQPTTSLVDGLAPTVDYYRSQLD